MVERVYIVRHGETEWSRTGRHTGRTEVGLSTRGEADASLLSRLLADVPFARVFSSPRLRAARTCELAGLGRARETDPDLAEWDYGDYEGLTSAEIRAAAPGWRLFRDGCPGGEAAADVGARADRVVARLLGLEGTVALFTHGHFSRVLAARWVGQDATFGERLQIDTSSVGILSHEHADRLSPVISLWNRSPSGPAA